MFQVLWLVQWHESISANQALISDLSTDCAAPAANYSWCHFFNMYGHRHNSIDEFFENFPGNTNTSDFSDAIQKGIDAVVKQYCSEKVREVLTESQLQVIYRLCEGRYKWNLNHTANISTAVDPRKKGKHISRRNQMFSVASRHQVSHLPVCCPCDALLCSSLHVLWDRFENHLQIDIPTSHELLVPHGHLHDLVALNFLPTPQASSLPIQSYLDISFLDRKLRLECTLEVLTYFQQLLHQEG